MKPRVVVIQPLVPHYRREFFEGLAGRYDLRILVGRENRGFRLEGIGDRVEALPRSVAGPFEYYRGLGFVDGELYQHRPLESK